MPNILDDNFPRPRDPFANIGRKGGTGTMDWLYENIRRNQERQRLVPPPVASLRSGSAGKGSFNQLWSQLQSIVPNVARGLMQNAPQQQMTAEDIFRAALAEYMQGGAAGGGEASARAIASAQFDPQISAIEQLMATTKRRGSYNKAQLGNMFSALSNSLKEDIPDIREITASSSKAAKSRYKGLERDIGSMYRDVADEETALLQRLDQQAAAPDVFKEQFADKAFTSRQTKEESASVLSALQQMGQSAEDFTRSGAQIARGEGTTRQADLMMRLQELLAEQGGQLAGLQGAKQAAYLEALQGSQPDPNQRFNQLMEAARFKFQLEQSMQKPIGPTPTNGITAAADVLTRQAPGMSQDAMGILYNTLMSPEAEGLEPEQIAALVRENSDLNPQQQLALINAILAYYGKY